MHTPLADRLRPSSLEEIAGQDHLVGSTGWVTRAIKGGRPLSILLWGPPGCGKTTLARLYAKAFDLPFVTFSAVFNGVADLKKLMKEAQETPLFRRQIMIFVDEIHRFNRAQQDAFLPFVEDGSLILVGATTENPSFALVSALLSRLRVLVLHPLSEEALLSLVERYEAASGPLPITPAAKEALASLSAGDARHLFNMIESLSLVPQDTIIDTPELLQFVQKRPAHYDKADDGHYNLISALHKAVRGSDPDAALYWLCRMLEGGEDPQFIARRMVRMASEDVGLADPQALELTLNAWRAYDQLGSPEGELALAQALIYLALAPKSNALYTAYGQARELASKTSSEAPPKIILNAPTKLMKNLGYGKGYIYDHDTKAGFSGQNYFPDGMERQEFYQPVERGFERDLKKRMDYFAKLRNLSQ